MEKTIQNKNNKKNDLDKVMYEENTENTIQIIEELELETVDVTFTPGEYRSHH